MKTKRRALRFALSGAFECLERRELLAFDFGDAPDVGPGVGAGEYQTIQVNGGPGHDISLTSSTLFLGAGVDGRGACIPAILQLPLAGKSQAGWANPMYRRNCIFPVASVRNACMLSSIRKCSIYKHVVFSGPVEWLVRFSQW